MGILIGAVLGGPGPRHDEIETTWQRFSRSAKDVSRSHPDSDNIEVVFDAPGATWKPTYEGIRTGRLAHKDRRLQVQVAVPAHLPAGTVHRFFANALVEAVRLGNAYAERRLKGWTSDSLLSIAAEVAARDFGE